MLIIGKDIGPLLRLAQILNPQAWHLAHFKQSSRSDAAVPCQNGIFRINQNRIRKSEFFDTGCDLLELFFRVGPRVA